eukprot:36118-Eustigmatos_ZCMA.PRE.1
MKGRKSGSSVRVLNFDMACDHICSLRSEEVHALRCSCPYLDPHVGTRAHHLQCPLRPFRVTHAPTQAPLLGPAITRERHTTR